VFVTVKSTDDGFLSVCITVGCIVKEGKNAQEAEKSAQQTQGYQGTTLYVLKTISHQACALAGAAGLVGVAIYLLLYLGWAIQPHL
jgi:hypothetical protein